MFSFCCVCEYTKFIALTYEVSVGYEVCEVGNKKNLKS